MTMQHYPVEIHWSEEDEGYIATFPDLPGCSAWGASETVALEEAHTAAAAWLDACEAAGNPTPEPTPLESEASFSGRFILRVPKRLHAELARSAKRQGVSLNQYVLYLLSERQGQRSANAG